MVKERKLYHDFFMKKLLFFAVILSFSACRTDETSSDVKVMGYRPVYVSYEEIKKVGIETARKLTNPAKIYVRGAYLFINEPNEGIHVVNNADPKLPKPIAFIKIPGNQDIELKDNVMYVDNGLDLIAIDISSPQSVKVLKRIENVFPYPSYPPTQNVKFECADEQKGYPIKWELVELNNPKCYR
jgi:hypothetical protein